MTKTWMIDDAYEGLKANFAFADAGMTVFMAGTGVLAVVEMNGAEAIKINNVVEFSKYVVQMIADIVAGIPYMASVKTDADMFV